MRQFLAELAGRGLQDTTRHDYARAIRTLLRFWHREGYTPQPVTFDMPRLEKKRLPVLDAEQLKQIVKACNVRDKAVILFLADSGLRRAEVINLNWSDVDMQSGLVKVKQGKGKKDRSAVVGARTRRALYIQRLYSYLPKTNQENRHSRDSSRSQRDLCYPVPSRQDERATLTEPWGPGKPGHGAARCTDG